MSPVLAQRLLPGREMEGLRRWLPVLSGLAVMYVPTYIDLAQGLWRQDTYAHGPIVLAVAAWLAWRQRGALDGEPEGRASASLAGGVALALGLALYIVGRSQSVTLFEVGSHLPVLVGTVLLLGGWRALRGLWFALFFLVFLVPLPGFVIYAITGPLKDFVSLMVDNILYGFGYPVARSGVVLSIGQYQLLIADACAGLNSIYSLAALGLLYLYLTASGNRARGAVLLASIVPIALAANLLRVLALALVTFHLGDAAGQGFFHASAGMALFVIALLLLLGLDALLRLSPAFRPSRVRP
ncbi:MAG: exosortase B [Burkholderiales bacterium]